MPDNYGRYTASELSDGMRELLFPRCSYEPPKQKAPLFCPKCGLLGAHVGQRPQSTEGT